MSEKETLKQNDNASEQLSPSDTGKATARRKKSLPYRIFKWITVTVVSVFALIVLLITLAVWILSPGQLTPLIEELGSDYLNAKVEIDKAELTFWKTFPRLKISVDGLNVISKSLDGLPSELRSTLPANADSVMSVGHFEGGINVLKILGGTIHLNDVEIDRPRINLIQVTDSVSNFDIFPQSEPDTTKLSLPDIYINRFRVTNAAPISYKSLSDTIDFNLNLTTIEMDNENPMYSLKIDTRIETPMLNEIAYKEIEFKLNGGIGWSPAEPYQIRLENIAIVLAELDARFNAAINLENDLTIESFDFDINRLNINKLKKHFPQSMREVSNMLHTTMEVDISAKLTSPYTFSSQMGIPSFTAKIDIPDCELQYNQLQFNSLAINLTADIKGNNINRSIINLNKLAINGNVIDASLSGSATNLMADPLIKGRFDGKIDFSRFPRSLTDKINASIKGILKGATDFRFHVSDLSAESFHKMRFNGEIDLSDFHLITLDSITSAYARFSTLTFGSNERFRGDNGVLADSLLILRVKSDTISIRTNGIAARIRNLAATVGASNTSSTHDTTVISPIGGYIGFDRAAYDSEIDRTNIRLVNAKGFGSLQRYKGNSKVPQLGLRLNIGKVGVRHEQILAGVEESSLEFVAHFNPRFHNRKQNKQPVDSLTGARRRRNSTGSPIMTKSQLDSIGAKTLELDKDNSLRSLLFRWNIKAELKAKNGAIRMPYIHLPNRFNNLDVAIDTDSIALNSLHYNLGSSDFAFNGAISNLKGALYSRRPTPLRLDFNVVSDLINVNEVAKALASPEKKMVHNVGSSIDSWASDELKEIVQPEESPDSVFGPILVPVNIDAGFTFNANKVIYSNLLLRELQGQILVYHGVMNINNLSAKTDLGNLNLSALYAAPTPNNMSFGLGMLLNKVRIDQLPQVVPSIDTIMPIMHHLNGIVDANIAVTCDLTPDMYLKINTLKSAMKFTGDSLALSDYQAFKKISKWLLFKDKNQSMIDHISMEFTVDNGVINIYPFIIDIDRYKLGVMGMTNLDFDMNYHIAVLKSPIPFKFGINIKGKPDNMKIRLGGAKFKEKMITQRDSIASNMRINLLGEMNRVFKRGLRAARLGPLDIQSRADTTYMSAPESIISHQDSLLMIQEGLIAAPDTIKPATTQATKSTKKGKRKNDKSKR